MKPMQMGTAWVNELEVPRYETARGQSVKSAAKALGFRVLERREPDDGVVAVIACDGLQFRCVLK